jgi:hypothetical protein
MRRFMQSSTAFLHYARTILCFGGENEWPRRKDNSVIVLKPGGPKQPNFEIDKNAYWKNLNKTSRRFTVPGPTGLKDVLVLTVPYEQLSSKAKPLPEWRLRP